jgi:hypothetical protein
VSVEALGGGVEVVGAHAEGPLDSLPQGGGEGLAARGDALQINPQAAGLLLHGQQARDRGIAVQRSRLELVQPRDDLGEGLGHAQRTQPVQPHGQGLGPALAHVRGRAAADGREAQPGEARPGVRPPAAAQEHRHDAGPRHAVVHEHGLPSRRAARGSSKCSISSGLVRTGRAASLTGPPAGRRRRQKGERSAAYRTSASRRSCWSWSSRSRGQRSCSASSLPCRIPRATSCRRLIR